MVIFKQYVGAAISNYKRSNPGVAAVQLTPELNFTTTIGWEDLVYYQNEHNLVAQQIDSKEHYGSIPDDGAPQVSEANMDVFAEATGGDGNPAFYDIDGDDNTEFNNTEYAWCTVSPNVVMSAQTGIMKHIKGDGGKWTDIDHTDINREYQYRVRVANGDNTHVTDLIIYDTLEDAANTELTSGEVTWKGSFSSVDTSFLERHGYAPVVYYSTRPVSELDYNLVTGREDNIWIDDTSVWSSELPANPAEVTAIAVDIRKMADGTDAVLEQNQGVEFIINMVAPPEYPTLSDPDMVYAINRPAYHSYQYVAYAADGTYFTDIGRRVKIYLEPQATLTIRKISENQETPSFTRFTVTGPNGFEDSFYYDDMQDGVYVIENLALGRYTIKENLSGDSFTVSVDGAANVTQESEGTGYGYRLITTADVDLTWDEHEKTVIITNTSKYRDLSGEKIWEERGDVTEANFTEEEDYPSSRIGYAIAAFNGDELVKVQGQGIRSSTWSISDLPVQDSSGEEIEYRLEEWGALGWDHYSTEYDWDNETISFFTVQNDKLSHLDTIKLVLVREWYSEDEGRTLYEIADTLEVSGASFAEEEHALWEDLDREDTEAEKYYTYSLYVAPDNLGYAGNFAGDTLTNTRLMEVSATKVWDMPEDAEQADVTLILNKTVDGVTTEVEGQRKTIAADAESSTVTWKNLPEYEDGKPVTYSVTEATLEGFELVSVTGNDIDGFILTNRPLVTVSGAKTWEDAGNQDGMRPESITIRLYADGKEVASAEVSAEDEWSYSFEDMPKYTEEGREITYTITEDTVDNYTSEVDGFDVTNTHTPGKTQVNVTKSWDDANDQDGLRPTSVAVKLLADGEDTGKTLTLTAEDNWTGTFTDLDLMKDGKKIVYTVEEVAVEGYEASVEGDAEAGYTITNKHTPKPEEPKPEEPKPEEPKPETPKPVVPKSEIPHTGDDTNPVLPLTLLALAGAGFAGAYRLRKREER